MAFQGVRPVLHTPFGAGPDEAIRYAEVRTLADRMVGAGVDGLVVLGLASEAWTLTETERDGLTAVAIEAAAGRVPVVVGVDGTTAVAADRGRRAARAGAAGLMVLPPLGARTVDQLVAHFGRLADAAGLPILVQDSPQVTGVSMAADTLLALGHAHPLIAAVKIEIPGAGVKISTVVAGGMAIVAGWGGLHYLESVRRGAAGCMPGCDLGPAIIAIDRAIRSGDAAAADALYRRILPLLAYETASLELLLLGAKRHLRRLGVFSSERLRSPGRALDAEEAATLDELFDRLAADRVPSFTVPTA